VIAAIFEAQLTEEQARQLVELMRESRARRPDRYLSTSTPRATELMRKVGAEPTVRLVPVLEHE
jgi:hypothetical protein